MKNLLFLMKIAGIQEKIFMEDINAKKIKMNGIKVNAFLFIVTQDIIMINMNKNV